IARKEKIEAAAKAWARKKEKEIVYLGENVSAGLNNLQDSDAERLKKNNLTDIASAEQLAALMKIEMGQLRFLSYHRAVSRVSHYKKFTIPKKTGGVRTISAPMPKLKTAQHWILENILDKILLHDAAHGFVNKKSIVTNATPHLKSEVVINIDLKDFFPSVHYPRVKGMFRKLGYNEAISTIFSLICTEAEQDEVEIDGVKYYVKDGNRKLPQGAPTSPAITNIICRKMDARFTGLSKKYGFAYTRYADDLTFSASGDALLKLKQFIALVKKVISSERFTLHPDKFKVMRKGARKEVTGIVVNEKPAIEKKKLKKFRALLFQIEKEGSIAGKKWGNSKNLLAAIKGYSNFINMVDPVKGKSLIDRANKILEQHKFAHVIVHKAKPKVEPVVIQKTTSTVSQSQYVSTTTAATQQVAPEKTDSKKPWWKFWS
ncbi:MAG: RNA-directed DNA polymerase, partial [Bacteroidia bacterium]|nr:RNA-directed DNA polymerase [Bacteroidia bacterium]